MGCIYILTTNIDSSVVHQFVYEKLKDSDYEYLSECIIAILMDRDTFEMLEEKHKFKFMSSAQYGPDGLCRLIEYNGNLVMYIDTLISESNASFNRGSYSFSITFYKDNQFLHTATTRDIIEAHFLNSTSVAFWRTLSSSLGFSRTIKIFRDHEIRFGDAPPIMPQAKKLAHNMLLSYLQRNDEYWSMDFIENIEYLFSLIEVDVYKSSMCMLDEYLFVLFYEGNITIWQKTIDVWVKCEPGSSLHERYKLYFDMLL